MEAIKRNKNIGIMHFIELNLENGNKISLNTSLIMNFYKGVNGKCYIVFSNDENFAVAQDYEDVKKLIELGSMIWTL